MRNWLIVSVVILSIVGTACSRRPDKLSAGDKDGIAKFLTAYQKTPYADRITYVLDPVEFEKVQGAFYKGAIPPPDEIRTVINSVKPGPKADYLTVMARYDVISNGKPATVEREQYLVNTKDGLKVDWAANTGYNPVGFTAWAAGTDRELTLRVWAALSGYYNYQYGEAQGTHYSLGLVEEVGDRAKDFNGYVPKDSDLGRRLFEIVRDGRPHKLIVTIERTGRELSVVGIKQLVSESWVK
jgi:hypothetical protein